MSQPQMEIKHLYYKTDPLIQEIQRGLRQLPILLPWRITQAKRINPVTAKTDPDYLYLKFTAPLHISVNHHREWQEIQNGLRNTFQKSLIWAEKEDNNNLCNGFWIIIRSLINPKEWHRIK